MNLRTLRYLLGWATYVTGWMLFWSVFSSLQGCYVASREFWLYGYCEDAVCRVWNGTPKTIAVRVGGDPKIYSVPSGSELIIPGRYPVFSQVHRRIPISASVTPYDPMVRDAGMTWNFSNQGHTLNGYGGYTQGKEVHAIIELQNPDPKAKANQLVFRVQQ